MERERAKKWTQVSEGEEEVERGSRGEKGERTRHNASGRPVPTWSAAFLSASHWTTGDRFTSTRADSTSLWAASGSLPPSAAIAAHPPPQFHPPKTSTAAESARCEHYKELRGCANRSFRTLAPPCAVGPDVILLAPSPYNFPSSTDLLHQTFPQLW